MPAATPCARRTPGLDCIIAVAAVLIVALAVPAVRHLRETTPPSRPEMRLEITTPADDRSGFLAISPDGRKIVFVASAEGGSRLVAAFAGCRLGTAAGRNRWRGISLLVAGQPVHWILCGWQAEADRHRRRNSADAGERHPVAVATWNRDGMILFAPSGVSPIFRISATGGEPSAVTRLEPPQQA